MIYRILRDILFFIKCNRLLYKYFCHGGSRCTDKHLEICFTSATQYTADHCSFRMTDKTYLVINCNIFSISQIPHSRFSILCECFCRCNTEVSFTFSYSSLIISQDYNTVSSLITTHIISDKSKTLMTENCAIPVLWTRSSNQNNRRKPSRSIGS